MTTDDATTLSMHCRCGSLHMTATGVHPGVANRVVCHCEGCRTFARRMDPGLLDDHGGTERFQVSPACLDILSGHDQLECVQQTRGGAYRWLARCCGTPLGLTLSSSGVPFVGLDVARVDRQDLDPVIGPVRARVNTAREARLAKAGIASLLAMLWHIAPLTMRWWWRGDHRRSPFFDPQTGEPVVAPARLYTTVPTFLGVGCG